MDVHFLLVTASYNRPELLIRTIESVLKQGYQNWQQIIVDDCSTADMSAVEALAASDPRIVFIRLPHNQGCNKVRNRALDWLAENKAQGYVSLLDDDDYLLPDALKNANDCIKGQPGYQWYTTDCCYPDGKKISRMKHYGELSYIRDYMFDNVIKGDLHHYIHADLLGDFRFTERFRNGQEWSFYSELSGVTNFYAFDVDTTVKEYLVGGLSQLKVNSQNRLSVCEYKVEVLAPLCEPKLLALQQLALAKELIVAGKSKKALELLRIARRYAWYRPRFLRYYIKALLTMR